MKKRILLVVDNEEWALGNIAYKLKENLKEFYDINVVTLEMFKDNIVKIMILSKKYDLIHFLWRGHIYWLYSDFAKDYIKNLNSDKVVEVRGKGLMIGIELNINAHEIIDKCVEDGVLFIKIGDHVIRMLRL